MATYDDISLDRLRFPPTSTTDVRITAVVRHSGGSQWDRSFCAEHRTKDLALLPAIVVSVEIAMNVLTRTSEPFTLMTMVSVS